MNTEAMSSSQERKPLRKPVPLQREEEFSANVATVFSENACDLYFYVQNSDEIGKLSFKKASAFRSVRTDCTHQNASFLIQLVNSDWPSEMDSWVYGGSLKAQWHIDRKNRAKHFIAYGHDIYHEFLCEDFTEQYISKNDEEYKHAYRILCIRP